MTETNGIYLLLDSQGRVAEKISALLKRKFLATPRLEVVDDVDECIRLCGELKPAKLFLSISSSDIFSAALVKKIRELYPALPITILYSNEVGRLAMAGMFKGAQDFVDTDHLTEEIFRDKAAAANVEVELSECGEQTPAYLTDADIKLMFFELYEHFNSAVIIWKAQTAEIFCVNSAAVVLLGQSAEELLGKNYSEIEAFKVELITHFLIQELDRNGFIRLEHINLLCRGGILKDVEMNLQKFSLDETSFIKCTIRNISERSSVVSKTKLISSILRTFSEDDNWRDSIKPILKHILDSTEIEAIALRLKAGSAFPILDSLGFSPSYLKSDRALCFLSVNSLTEVISKEPEYSETLLTDREKHLPACSLPFCTSEGSFWVNDIAELSSESETGEIDPHCVEHCLGAGYTSVAVIPVKNNDNLIGLLQLNDSRPGSMTFELISLLEEIAAVLGIILRKREDEIRLKQSEDQLKVIVEATRDVIYRLNYETMKFDYINPAIVSLTGYTEQEINNIGFASVVVKVNNPDGSELSRNKMRERREKRITDEFRADYQIKTKTGEMKWISDHSHPWFDIEGRLIGSIGVLSDITGRKEAEEELLRLKNEAEELSRLKTSFVDNMSHELRTPMIGILGYAEIMQHELSDPYLKEMAEMIEQSGRRLMNTLNLILELSSLESRNESIGKTGVELIGLLKEIMNTETALAQKKQLYVRIESEYPALLVRSNERMLWQIFDNLINNALKFTETGGITISVSLDQASPEYLIVKVIDTGIGIDKNAQGIIWEEFRQASEGQNRNYQGTGLGLTITKKFVEKLSGTIDLISAPGAGSTFIVSIPCIDTSMISRPSAPLESVTEYKFFDESELQLPRVLVVDDDRITRNVINKFLMNICEIDFAENGQIAIRKAGEKTYNAILMDVNLGSGLNGIQTAAEIRKIPGMESVPVAAVTAYAMKGDEETIIASGFDYYIAKPFKKQEFIAFVNKVMGIE